jgi:hypothetical protein
MALYTQGQGRCTIVRAEVVDNDMGGDGYLVRFTYDVLTPQERHYQAQGYRGPRIEEVPTREAADTILKNYPVGSTHPCWYPKEDPSRAVLVLNWEEFAWIPWMLGIGMGLALQGILTWLLWRMPSSPRMRSPPKKESHGVVEVLALLLSFFASVSGIMLIVTGLFFWSQF